MHEVKTYGTDLSHHIGGLENITLSCLHDGLLSHHIGGLENNTANNFSTVRLSHHIGGL